MTLILLILTDFFVSVYPSYPSTSSGRRFYLFTFVFYLQVSSTESHRV
jgi:hypothetical protein